MDKKRVGEIELVWTLVTKSINSVLNRSEIPSKFLESNKSKKRMFVDSMDTSSKSLLDVSTESLLGNEEAKGQKKKIVKAGKWSKLAFLKGEKRALKKRLIDFDNAFEKKYKKKPGREDKAQKVHHIYAAYNAIKEVISHKPQEGVVMMPAQVALEKNALQHYLKVYERDFFSEHGRKVTLVEDIAPRVGDYRRYKQLKNYMAS